MIELAPNHKFGLPIATPVMPAAGFWRYGGNPYVPIIDAARFGALVTNPITLRPRRYAPPHFAEVPGGVIFHHPAGNFGVKKIIRANVKFWRNSPVPVIAHLPADDPADMFRTARALDSTGGITAFEIGFSPDHSAADVRACISAVMDASELPVLAKIPLTAQNMAKAALAAGADALTLTATPVAGFFGADGSTISGEYFGLGIAAPAVPPIIATRKLFPDTPLVVSGGIHTPADAQSYLRAGATAVQLDTVIFTNPIQVQQILEFKFE